MSELDIPSLNLDRYAKLSKKVLPKSQQVIYLEQLINKLILPDTNSLYKESYNGNHTCKNQEIKEDKRC